MLFFNSTMDKRNTKMNSQILRNRQLQSRSFISINIGGNVHFGLLKINCLSKNTTKLIKNIHNNSNVFWIGLNEQNDVIGKEKVGDVWARGGRFNINPLSLADLFLNRIREKLQTQSKKIWGK